MTDAVLDTEGVVCVGGNEFVTVTEEVVEDTDEDLAVWTRGCLLLFAPCPPNRPPEPLSPLPVCLLSNESLPAVTLSGDPNLRSVCPNLALLASITSGGGPSSDLRTVATTGC